MNSVKSLLIFCLVLSILAVGVAAQVDIFQNRYSDVNVTQALDPGPKGIGGLLVALNASTNAPVLHVSGTWFEDTDRIIVNALLLQTVGLQSNEPITGANCTISLKDSTLTQIVTSAQMLENNITGQPHYTYNQTNISAIASGVSSGKFFGHVVCIKGAPQPFTIYQETDFEVHPITNTLLSEIRSTKSFLQNLLQRQFDFSQEEVFLITDSFTSMSKILDAVESGRMSGEDAKVQFEEIEAHLEQGLGGKYGEARFMPKAGLSSFVSEIAQTPRKLAQNRSFTAVLTFLVVVFGAYLIYHGKHEDEF